jgi:hypothetical protein
MDDAILEADDVPGKRSLCQSALFLLGKDHPYSRKESGDTSSAWPTGQTLRVTHNRRRLEPLRVTYRIPYCHGILHLVL